MRSRIAIIALLATGALLGGGGVAVGVSALSTTGDASEAQYGSGVGTNEVLRTTATSPDASSVGITSSGGEDPRPPTSEAQVKRQSGGDDKLPFTGYAAIPVLLIGLCMLLAGLGLRSRSRRNSAAT